MWLFIFHSSCMSDSLHVLVAPLCPSFISSYFLSVPRSPTYTSCLAIGCSALIKTITAISLHTLYTDISQQPNILICLIGKHAEKTGRYVMSLYLYLMSFMPVYFSTGQDLHHAGCNTQQGYLLPWRLLGILTFTLEGTTCYILKNVWCVCVCAYIHIHTYTKREGILLFWVLNKDNWMRGRGSRENV